MLAAVLARGTKTVRYAPKNHLPGIFRGCAHMKQTLVNTVVAAVARRNERSSSYDGVLASRAVNRRETVGMAARITSRRS